MVEPGSMWLMILGIIFLCQPWVQVLHDYSVTLMLIGLIGIVVELWNPGLVFPGTVGAISLIVFGNDLMNVSS